MDNQPLNKITTGSYYLVFDQIITYGMGALFWILLAKILPTADIGQTMVVIALSTVVLGFTGLGAEVTISKFISEHNARNNPQGSRKAFSFGLKTGLGVSVAAGLFLAIFSSQVATLFYHNASVATLIFVAMLTYLPSQTILSCFFGAFQGSQKMKYVAITDLIFQVSRISVALLFVALAFGGLSLVLSFAVGSVVALAASYFLFVRRLFAHSEIENNEPVELIGIRSFSGFNYLATGITTFAAQLNYILLGGQTFSSVALFGISYLISGVVGVIVLSFGKAVLPTASAEVLNLDKTSMNSAISMALKVATILSGFIYIALIVAPGLILSSLSHEYVAASGALQLLVLSAILLSLSSFIGFVLNGINRPGWVARIAIISSICVIVGSAVLVPRFGIEGAAASALLGSSVALALSIWQSRVGNLLMISYGKIYKPFLSIAIAIVLGLVVSDVGKQPSYVSLLVSIVCYVGLIAAFRATTRSELSEMVHIAVQASGLAPKR